MPKKKLPEKPRIYKRDRIGFNIDDKSLGNAELNRNAYAVSSPFLVKDEWYISANFSEYRFAQYDWRRDEAKTKDFNVPCKFVYLVDRDKRNKLRDLNMTKLSKPAIVTGIVLSVFAILVLWTVGNYNSLVTARNAVSNSRAKIDTQLERRYELVDNVVASVQGSQAQESDVFGKIAEARKIGGSATTPEAQAEANATIDTQIALLPRLQEAYPELKSNNQVSTLIAELQGTANSVRETRDRYNDTVTNFNNNITKFPKSMFAGFFNFDQEQLFKARTEALNNPKVDLKRQ